MVGLGWGEESSATVHGSCGWRCLRIAAQTVARSKQGGTTSYSHAKNSVLSFGFRGARSAVPVHLPISFTTSPTKRKKTPPHKGSSPTLPMWQSLLELLHADSWHRKAGPLLPRPPLAGVHCQSNSLPPPPCPTNQSQCHFIFGISVQEFPRGPLSLSGFSYP